MRHGLKSSIHLWAQGPRLGDEHYAYARCDLQSALCAQVGSIFKKSCFEVFVLIVD